MRREAANENVSMQSSFENVSGLPGWPSTEERPPRVGGPRPLGVPESPAPSGCPLPGATGWGGAELPYSQDT